MAEKTTWDISFLDTDLTLEPLSGETLDMLRAARDCRRAPLLWAPARAGEEEMDMLPMLEIEAAADRMEGGDLPLGDMAEALIAIHYPLDRAVAVRVLAAGPNGITRREAVAGVAAAYREIYRLEHAKAGDPGHVGAIPGAALGEALRDIAGEAGTPDFPQTVHLANRKSSEGPFGIWGHDLRDLWLEGLLTLRRDDRVWILPELGS